MSDGYLYHVPSSDRAMLRGLVRDLVGFPCWTFGGAALWDSDPSAGRDNLRPITQIQAVEALDLRGDFGHAFSAEAEVRWQRRDTDHHDALVLLERALTAQECADTGVTLVQQFIAVEAPATNAVLLSTPAEIQRRSLHWQLTYIEYRAANGAVQMVRYQQRAEQGELRQ